MGLKEACLGFARGPTDSVTMGGGADLRVAGCVTPPEAPSAKPVRLRGRPGDSRTSIHNLLHAFFTFLKTFLSFKYLSKIFMWVKK